MSKEKSIPQHLASIYKMLRCTFPHGLTRESPDYLPLLALLYLEMSDRNLAEVISLCFYIDRYGVMNDIYETQTQSPSFLQDISRIRQKLIPYGFDKWLEED